MKSNNVFADHVAVRGPPSASLTKIFTIMLAQTTRTGHIIRQRIDPDVHDLRSRRVASRGDGVGRCDAFSRWRTGATSSL